MLNYSQNNSRRGRLLVAILLVCWGAIQGSMASLEAADGAGGATETKKSTDQLIHELIEKLGSDSYATRIRARNQLKMYGLEAFDALREAQNHDDSEILSAARYLISSLQVSWSKDSDPKEVQEILSEYGAQNEADRLGRIELLGRLRDQMGVEPLARLARFDPSVPLSRRAAMLVLKQPLGREKASRRRLAERIESVIGENDRDPSQWLLAYAADLRAGSYSPERWAELVRQQRMQVDSGVSPDVTSASVMQMIRVLATRALSEDARQSALALVMEHIDLIAPATRDLSEHAGWSIRQGLFPIVVTLYEKHQHTFRENAELLYSAAQAYDEIGQSELAQELAAEALQINPLPEIAASDSAEPGDEEKPKAVENAITDHQLQEIAYAHYQVALLLRSRGRFKWAERENREVIKHCDIESIVGVSARQELARMFSEQLRHDDAATVLFPIADRAQKDRLYQSRMGRWQISLSRIRSLYEYESGLALLEKSGEDRASLNEVKSKLQLAYRFDNDNIDILIRMYRLDDPGDPDWKQSVTKQIVQNRDALKQRIARIESRKKIIDPKDYKAELGDAYNQYAWLVSNTEGDYERALKCSLDSLEFLDADDIPYRAARLDTCARCYFALGRVEEAVATQQQAIKLDPFSPPMLRQLEEFQAAL
ncbi:Tetratricopeptide repeat protein [Stieleria maiorica]|uniref:Tetratricopeptide repeat protein n=2 Tax=Stieleria maiorica TaxID=2795974 RepID=A0A5B9ME19_9BACT|nr:Tetratricopeptide repeat protein [Stieleria maiorica]